MALPTSRNTTYAPGVSPVKGNDLNALQDAIIGAKKPSLVRPYGPLGCGLVTAGAAWTHVINGTAAGNYIMSSAANANTMIYFDLDVGDRITGLTCRAYGDAAVDCTFTAGYVDVANSQLVSLGSLVDTNRAAAYGDAIITPFTSRVIQVGEVVAVHLNVSAINYRIAKWFLTYDRL